MIHGVKAVFYVLAVVAAVALILVLAGLGAALVIYILTMIT